MATLKDRYKSEISAQLKEELGLDNVMEVPRITKITLNMGVGEAISDRKILDNAVGDMTRIAGQKPQITTARKSIAGFKIASADELRETVRVINGALGGPKGTILKGQAKWLNVLEVTTHYERSP